MKYNEIYKYKRTLMSYNRETREPRWGPERRTPNGLPIIHASTVHSDQQPGESTSSKHEIWICRSRVVRSNPTSDKISAKWQTQAGKCVHDEVM